MVVILDIDFIGKRRRPPRSTLTDTLWPYPTLFRSIRALPQHSLAAGAQKCMSLAGAQHKLVVILRDGQLLQPVGSEPSTHILKPDHPDPDYPHSAVNEWFVMRLARRMGLTVPDVSRRYVPEPLYLIERFDRSLGPAGVQRLHAIDACQLLNLDRQFKYQQGSIEDTARSHVSTTVNHAPL